MVHPSPRNVPMPRRYPLMLSDGQRTTKLRPTPSSSQSSGPTIRELDPTEFLVSDAETVTGEKLNRGDDFVIRQFVDDKKDEYVSSTFINKSPYVVLSPESGVSAEDLNQAQTLTASSPWLNLDLSDNDSEAMTPINPVKVNPKVAGVIPIKSTKRPLVQPGPSPTGKVAKFMPTAMKFTNAAIPLPAGNTIKPSIVKTNRVAVGVPVTKGIASKKGRKNTKPKKTLRTLAKRKSDTPVIAPSPDISTSDLSNVIKVEIPDIGDPNNDAGVTILKMSPIYEPEEQIDDTFLTSDPVDEPLDPVSLALVRPNSGFVSDDVTRDLGNHVDSVQGDLDILKEFLKGDNCSLDASQLLELFNDDPLSYNMPPASENKTSKEDESAGNELMTYGQPNLLDLVDLYGHSSGNSVSPTSPTPSILNTPIATPLSPLLPTSSGKKRRK